jgi:hypothetical protein
MKFTKALDQTIELGVWISCATYPHNGYPTRIRYHAPHGTFETQTGYADGWRNDSQHFDAWPWLVDAACVTAEWEVLGA